MHLPMACAEAIVNEHQGGEMRAAFEAARSIGCSDVTLIDRPVAVTLLRFAGEVMQQYWDALTPSSIWEWLFSDSDEASATKVAEHRAEEALMKEVCWALLYTPSDEELAQLQRKAKALIDGMLGSVDSSGRL